MKYVVRVLFMGMMSEPKEFATLFEAEREARELRKLPGLVPIVEEVEE